MILSNLVNQRNALINFLLTISFDAIMISSVSTRFYKILNFEGENEITKRFLVK